MSGKQDFIEMFIKLVLIKGLEMKIGIISCIYPNLNDIRTEFVYNKLGETAI